MSRLSYPINLQELKGAMPFESKFFYYLSNKEFVRIVFNFFMI